VDVEDGGVVEAQVIVGLGAGQAASMPGCRLLAAALGAGWLGGAWRREGVHWGWGRDAGTQDAGTDGGRMQKNW
jgi:hypothetical protein